MPNPNPKLNTPPAGPAREGVDPTLAETRPGETEANPVVTSPSASRADLTLDSAGIPNVTVSGSPVRKPTGVAPNPFPVRGGKKVVVEMLVPYASAATVLVAGKAYELSEEFAHSLLETDPPSATVDVSEANRRALKPPTPDPEDKSNS